MRRLLLPLALLLCCGAAVAQEAPPKAIEINALKNPEVRTYRALLAGLDEFDNQHALAPTVPALRFRASSRGKGAPPAEPLLVRLVSDDDALTLPVDEGGRFTVPRNDALAAAKAELVLNRKRPEIRVEPEVRSPDLPANMRRLGDLRLECKVTVAIAKEEIPFWVVALVNTVLLTTDWCSNLGDKAQYSFRAEAPLAGAVLSAGERQLDLTVKDRGYTVPLSAKEWPDDAVITLTYAPGAP